MSDHPGKMTDINQISEELSKRECEILELVATGATNQQVAQTLGISINTVKAHLRRIFGKLQVESRTEATTVALRLGLIKMIVPSQDGTDAGRPTESGAEPVYRPIEWRLAPGQLLALMLIVVSALTLAIWPAPRAEQDRTPSRFVDLPADTGQGSDQGGDARWTPGAAMPTERARFAQALVDDVIYVIGGMAADGWSDAVERYDVATDQWVPHSSKPTAAANIGAAVVGARIYVPGGYLATGEATDILEIYDTATDTWSVGARLPVPLFAYAIAEYGDGFYLFGGHDGTDYLDTVYYYDAGADRWSGAGSLTLPRAFAAAVAAGDAIYVMGGFDGQLELTTCESFSPAVARQGGDAWTSHAPMSVGRAGHQVVAARDYLYVVGGGWDGYHLFNERYDLEHDIWSAFSSPVVGEWRTLGLSLSVGPDGTRLYAIGGWSGRPLNLVRVYRAEYRVFLPRQ